MARTGPHCRRRGATLPMVVVSVAALIGLASLAVDVAFLYVKKQAHVNACDAAALAGAWELPERTAAEIRARQACRANGLSDDRPDMFRVQFPGPDLIETDSQEFVSLGFSRIFGIQHVPVRARARARLVLPNTIRENYPIGLRPWAIHYQDSLVYGQEVSIKLGARDNKGDVYSSGNYYAVALSGPASPHYIHDIQYGADGVWRIGDMATTLPGNVVGPTRTGVDYLFEQATLWPWNEQTWQTCTESNPRVVLVALVDWSLAGGGRTQVPILGFAAIYLTQMSDDILYGVYLKWLNVANGQRDDTIPPGIDHGLRTVTLIE